MKHLIALLLVCCQTITAQAASYGVAKHPTPVLNTPAFRSVFGGIDGTILKTDRCGQVRALEFIALPGTVFSIRSQTSDGNHTIYRVDSDEYPAAAGSPLYVDSRFIAIQEVQPPPRPRTLPTRTAIITALKAASGAPYVWGGNVGDGVAELIKLFYGDNLPSASRRTLTLAGLDCSGLLYQATGGWTPRNTSQLLAFGKAVPVGGKTPEEIIKSLEPLDLIVWNGHVLIVLDRETIIESRLECGKPGNGGVVMTSLQRRLTEIMRTKRPVDKWPYAGKHKDVFVVRRWVAL